MNIDAAKIECDKCDNTNPAKFNTVTDGYSAPRRDGYRGALVLVGYRCLVCGNVERIREEK